MAQIEYSVGSKYFPFSKLKIGLDSLLFETSLYFDVIHISTQPYSLENRKFSPHIELLHL